MPVGAAGSNPPANQANRTTFRPPWVKDGPQPMPMPSQPWVKQNRNFPPNEPKQEPPFLRPVLRKVSEPSTEKAAAATTAAALPADRKTSKITITPSLPKENGAPAKPNPEPPKRNFEVPKKQPEVVQKPPIPTDRRTSEVNIPVQRVETKPAERPLERQTSKTRVLERSKTSDKYEGLPGPPKPPAPPMPPMPPAPPPPPPMMNKPEVNSTLTPEKAKKLEALRSRPKKRPDWGNVMKEIETGRKLNHVQCNDRSSPLLPMVKAKGQFVYESEKPNLHNQLLKQIESGVRLKPTKTNDRSKPFIEGLRKFRRQMTIEEQIQKSASMASMGIVEVEPDPLDEVDDIDKVRDDLQSTKQLLAMELKNKEALERENKKLVTKILNLEVDLEKEKNKINKGAPADNNELQKEIKTLKEESEKAKKLADEMENKYHEIQAQYDLMKLDLDEATQKSQRLEKQLKVAQAANLANMGQPLTKQLSKKIVHQNKLYETPIAPESPEESDEEEETETETESETENEGEDEEEKKERRLLRELKLLTTKLRSFKTKRETAKKERKALKEQMSKLQKAIKEEKKKYKVLQKEVDKMSKLMNEDEDDEEVEDEEEVEEEEEEESTEEEEEETEESESEESEGDLPETAPPEKKKINLQGRAKKYENLLSSLKKGNYLLKANVDRYKDELNKQKEMALTLQEDLNSVLAELG